MLNFKKMWLSSWNTSIKVTQVNCLFQHAVSGSFCCGWMDSGEITRWHQEKQSEKFPGAWRTARPPSIQGAKPPRAEQISLYARIRQHWFFTWKTFYLYDNHNIQSGDLDIFKFITSFKINRISTPLLTNLLLGSSMKREQMLLVPVSLPATFDGFSQVPPPPIMQFEISTDLHWSHDHKFGWWKNLNSAEKRNILLSESPTLPPSWAIIILHQTQPSVRSHATKTGSQLVSKTTHMICYITIYWTKIETAHNIQHSFHNCAFIWQLFCYAHNWENAPKTPVRPEVNEQGWHQPGVSVRCQ